MGTTVAQARGVGRVPVAALALGVGVLAIGLLFTEELRAAVGVWIDSTAYGHCFFILPIIFFLAWERRAAALVSPVIPMPWLGLLALPMGVVWLGAERLGIMEGQQIMVLGFVELLFLAVLGWRMCWVLAVPLLYLFFLVPFGAFLTPALQHFTASFIIHGLDLLGIPNISDANTIEIPEGVFFVAEACAGLRFLIASVAFGVLYACMIYRSPGRRVGFILASIAIPVIANGFRGLGIVALGHLLGSAEAAAVDHVVYGWLFFSIVIMLLIVAGLPFREDVGPAPVPRWAGMPSNPAARALWTALVLVVGLTAVAPAVAGWLDRRSDGPLQDVAQAGLGRIAGCGALSAPVAAGGGMLWTAACRMNGPPGDLLTLTLTAWPSRANPGVLARERRVLTGELQAEDTTIRTLRTGDDAVWQLVDTTEPDRVIGMASWLDGRPAPGGLAQRRSQAMDSLFGDGHAKMLLTFATQHIDGRLPTVVRNRAASAIEALLDLNPDLARRVERLSEAMEPKR